MGVLRELQTRGFEIGVHGWRHDGRMYESLERFAEDCVEINRVLKKWNSVGFRSPMTHRHPVPMQELRIQYDTSFFDSDPWEPMPGGVMTIWPFMCGRFVELPYTLPQDHTLIQTVRDRTPTIWLEKTAFIAAHRGMALLNSHPEYICRDGNLRMYEDYLDAVAAWDGAWVALPRDVASWWRSRLSSEGIGR